MAVAKSCGASVTFTCAEMSDREHDPEHKCGPEGLMRQVVRCAARHGVDVAAENALYRCDATAFKQMVRNCKRGGGESSGAGMTSFTFLRMCDSLFEERNFREFATFVGDLSGNDARAGSP
jgi:beta-amylase